MVKRINELLKDIRRHPYEGIGKPEPLKNNLSGWWSRRIDNGNRIVYRQYDENTVCVLTPHGLRQIKKNFGQEDIVSFYIKVPRRDRLIKLLERGDEIDEAIRRNQSDVGQYDGIEDEVDFVIENEGYLLSPGYLAKQIYQSTNKKGEKPWDA